VINFTARRCYAQRGIATASRLPVRPSVTLTYRDDICWNTSKVISSLVSLWRSLFAHPKITDLLQREHSKIFTGIGVGCRKMCLLAYKSSNISETWQDRTKVTIADEDQ